MHKVLRENREGRPRPNLWGYEGGIEMSWVREGGCKRVARGEEGEKIKHQILKGLVHQINLSDLPLPLCFSRLWHPGMAHILKPQNKQEMSSWSIGSA